MFLFHNKKGQTLAIRLTVHHKPQLYMGKSAPYMVQIPIIVVCSFLCGYDEAIEQKCFVS